MDDDVARRLLNNQGMIMLALRCLLADHKKAEHLRADLDTAIKWTADAVAESYRGAQTTTPNAADRRGARKAK